MSQARDMARFVAPGASKVHLAPVESPTHVHFVLVPGVTMLAFASALEPLRIANQLTGQCLYTWDLLSVEGDWVLCSNGTRIAVDGTCALLQREAWVMVCAGVNAGRNIPAALPPVLRRHARHGGRVAGICTGAFALAAAGLLHSGAFTLHWENQPAFAETYPDLDIVDALYVTDGRITTCGGGNAAIDMMIDLIGTQFGEMLAMVVSDMCLHGDRRNRGRRQRMSDAARYQCRDRTVLRLIDRLEKAYTEGNCLNQILEGENVSRRQVERLFKAHLGMTPARFLKELRLERAHALIVETNLPLSEVAVASGFNSTEILRRAFRERFGGNSIYLKDSRRRRRA